MDQCIECQFARCACRPAQGKCEACNLAGGCPHEQTNAVCPFWVGQTTMQLLVTTECRIAHAVATATAVLQ